MSAEKIKKYLQESQKDKRWQESAQLREVVTESKEKLDESTKIIKENGKLVAKKNSNPVENDTHSDEKVFNADYLDTLARPPVNDVEVDYNAEEIARIKEQVGEMAGDMIETMEKLRIACEKDIQEELDRYVAAGGKAEDFEPQLIPYGIVYEAYMYDKKLKEQKRLKEERSLKNRLKKKFANKTVAEEKTKTTDAKKVTTASNENKLDNTGKTTNKVRVSSADSNCSTIDNSTMENSNAKRENPDKIVVGNEDLGSDDFKRNFEVDKNAASSANRIYEKKKSNWDKQREVCEAILLKRHELRELGIPVDETLAKASSRVLSFKIFSAMLIAASLVANDPQSTLTLAASGIIVFAGTKYADFKYDLKYRKVIDDVRKAYIRARGKMTEEDVQKILNTHKVKLPDKYALACMTKEERDEILESAKNPKELSKRKLIKHIKRELTNFEVKQFVEMRKQQKERAQDDKSNSR